VIERRFEAKLMWPTPVLSVLHDGAESLNAGLARAVLEQELSITSGGKGTPVAGLESGLTTHWMRYNVLAWDYPECSKFRELVLAGFRRYLETFTDPDDPGHRIRGISCWANVLRPGESLAIHHHDPGFVSAHYCVQSGVDDQEPATIKDSGQTQYYRPGFIDRSMGGAQQAGASVWDEDWKFSEKPTPGRLFFFPSYVRHEVRPNAERHPRITIAMDFYVDKQPTSKLIYFAPPRWYVPTLAP
jgi:hypothetical protein